MTTVLVKKGYSCIDGYYELKYIEITEIDSKYTQDTLNEYLPYIQREKDCSYEIVKLNCTVRINIA